jgi:hypothetical protein
VQDDYFLNLLWAQYSDFPFLVETAKILEILYAIRVSFIWTQIQEEAEEL